MKNHNFKQLFTLYILHNKVQKNSYNQAGNKKTGTKCSFFHIFFDLFMTKRGY